MDVQGTWDEAFLINISLDIAFAEDIKWSIPCSFPCIQIRILNSYK